MGNCITPTATPTAGGAAIATTADKPAAPSVKIPDAVRAGLACRQDLRSLSAVDQERFAQAILKMMENTKGPESSEYFRLAGYHGWPHDNCQHGVESFPQWHRAYLREFERTMQEADKQNGGDGKLGLPYWDWLTTDINGEFYPSILVKHFSKMPEGLVSTDNQLKQRGYQITKPEVLAKKMKKTNLQQMVWNTFDEELHFRAASTRQQGNSVESPHNTMHVTLGFPMASVAFAAFHPIFFLHHCNVDRIYEKYIQLQPDSKAEMENHQLKMSAGRREKNKYVEPLSPFRNPATKEFYKCEEMFDTVAMGFYYSELPGERADFLTEAPTHAIFWPIEPLEIVNQAYELHVWVIKAEDEASWKAPAHEDDYEKSRGYAGFGTVWGSKQGCTNCKERKPFDCKINCTQALDKQSLRRSQCVIKVVCLCEDTIVPLPAAIPWPKFVGPYFEGPISETLQKGSAGADVRALQTYLRKYQYFHKAPNGVYDGETEVAVKEFQEYLGITQTGTCDVGTKASIMEARDSNNYAHGDKDKATYEKGQEIKVWVCIVPGYMSRAKVLEEVKAACDTWGAACSLSFKMVETERECDLSIIWGDRTPDNMYLFDKKGGNLAAATKEVIDLDEAEYWVLQDETPNPRKKMPFEFQNVLLHELGHSLGMVHSNRADSVMFPHYVKGRIALAASDKEAIKAIYG